MIAHGFLTKQLGKCIGCISHPCTLFLTWSSLYRHSYCKSEMHQPNNFEIYRTSPECCNTHFPSSSTCLQDSKDSHAPFPFPAHPRQRPYSPEDAASDSGTEGSHSVRWFPDLINKLNCVRGRNYENWMTTEGYEEYYLFADSTLCCKLW